MAKKTKKKVNGTSATAKPTFIHMKVDAKLKRGLVKLAKLEDLPMTTVIRNVLSEHISRHV